MLDTIPAATVLQWHFELLRRAGELTAFAPVAGGVISRADRQQWLRSSLLAALPLNDDKARRLVHFVTPHSFRPGLAGDLLLEGLSLTQIATVCRWQGARIVRIYVERQPLSAFRSSTRFRLIARPR